MLNTTIYLRFSQVNRVEKYCIHQYQFMFNIMNSQKNETLLRKMLEDNKYLEIIKKIEREDPNIIVNSNKYFYGVAKYGNRQLDEALRILSSLEDCPKFGRLVKTYLRLLYHDLGLKELLIKDIDGKNLNDIFIADLYSYYLRVHRKQEAWKLLPFRKATQKLIEKKEHIFCDKESKNIVIYLEGGPGDQVKQSLVLKNLEKDYENIVVVCDKRLKMSMQRANPCFTYHSEFDGDYLRCYAQDLFCKYNHIHNNVYISLVANEHLVQYWQEIFALSNKKYIVGLCQGSHLYTVDRLINHFNVSDYEMIIESFTDVLFVNIGINEFNHKNVIDLNIDRKNDLESLIAVMECCDIIITSPNSLLDIAGGMGKYVLAISSTKKHEWRYGKNFDDFYHKKTKWIVAKDITNKRETISRAKNWLSNFLSKKSFYGVLDESFFCGVNGNADDEKIAKIGQALRNINEIEKSIDFLEKYIDKESLLIFNELSYSYAIIKDDMNVYRVLSMAYRSRKISEKMLKRYLDNLQKIKYIDIYRQILNEISNSPFQNSKYLQEHLTL